MERERTAGSKDQPALGRYYLATVERAKSGAGNSLKLDSLYRIPYTEGVH